jgi:hypothetical protein
MTKMFSSRRGDLIEVKCKCPKCGKMHLKKVAWTGRGVPRIACPKHATLFKESDDGELTYWTTLRYEKL